MANVHPQASSPLFRMPTEIRERIQRFALTENDLSTATRPVEFPDSVFRTYSDPLPSIMCTCKRMYLEMRPFAFTEIVVHHTPWDIVSGHSRTGVLSRGNLRFERVRRMSLVVDRATPDFFQPSWHGFLVAMFSRCPDMDSLDIDFGDDNGFRDEVEAKLPPAMERRQRGEERPGDEHVLDLYAMPPWLGDVARQPSLRRVCFEGNVPVVWLQKLRENSGGRIQIISDGIRFRERQVPVDNVADMDDPSKRLTEEGVVKDPQIQFVYEAASRFDAQ